MSENTECEWQIKARWQKCINSGKRKQSYGAVCQVLVRYNLEINLFCALFAVLHAKGFAGSEIIVSNESLKMKVLDETAFYCFKNSSSFQKTFIKFCSFISTEHCQAKMNQIKRLRLFLKIYCEESGCLLHLRSLHIPYQQHKDRQK